MRRGQLQVRPQLLLLLGGEEHHQEQSNNNSSSISSSSISSNSNNSNNSSISSSNSSSSNKTTTEITRTAIKHLLSNWENASFLLLYLLPYWLLPLPGPTPAARTSRAGPRRPATRRPAAASGCWSATRESTSHARREPTASRGSAERVGQRERERERERKPDGTFKLNERCLKLNLLRL